MKLQAKVAVIAGVSALVLAACGSSESGDGETEVSVGISGATSDAPFWIADEMGFFEEESIEVELLQFSSGSEMIPALGTGELDVGATAATAALYNAADRDVEVRIVADKGHVIDGSSYMAIMVRQELYDSGEVTSTADLDGRTVIDFAESSSTSAFLERALITGGLTIADVDRVFLPASEQLAALLNGSADASVSTEPHVTSMVDQGIAVRLPESDSYYPNQQTSVLLYGEQFADEDADAAERFMAAYLRGVEYLNNAVEDGMLTGENSEEVIDIIAEYTGIDADLLSTFPVNGMSVDGAVNVEGLREDFDFYVRYGYVNNVEMDPADLVDTTFVDAVANRSD